MLITSGSQRVDVKRRGQLVDLAIYKYFCLINIFFTNHSPLLTSFQHSNGLHYVWNK